MGRPIHYEYGSVVEQHRRLSFIHWTFICLILFALVALAPGTMQHYGVLFKAQTGQVGRETEEAPSVALEEPASLADKEAITTAVVDPKLQKLIEQWARRNAGESWGISVEHLGADHSGAQYQATERFEPAGLERLLMTQALSERIASDQWSKKNIYDYRGKHTYLECIDLMLRVSDNACGEAISNYVGLKNVDGRLVTIGLQNTKLGAGGGTYTTAADMSLFMRQVEEKDVLLRNAKAKVLDSLKGQQFRGGIPAGSGSCDVYDKTGDLNGFRHDVALVRCGKLVYSLAILSKDGSYAQIANLAQLVNDYYTE